MKVLEKNSIEKGDRIRIYSTKFDKNWTFKANDYEFFENGIEVENIAVNGLEKPFFPRSTVKYAGVRLPPTGTPTSRKSSSGCTV